MFVSPDVLRWQITLLKLRGFEFVTVAEGVRRQCATGLVALTFDDGYRDNLELGLPVLKSTSVPATVYVVTGDVGHPSVVWPESGEKNPADLMTWDELRRLQGEGWEIGSHASDHVHLGKKPIATQEVIIKRSWDDFVTNLGSPPTSFAYPYGSYNNDTLKILEDLHCSAAVTISPEGRNTADTPRLQLFRHAAKGYEFRHKIKSLNLLFKS